MPKIFQNPFRLIHEIYVYRMWSKEWRKNYPEYSSAFERNESNVFALIWQFYLLILATAVIYGVAMFVSHTWTIVRVVDLPVGLTT